MDTRLPFSVAVALVLILAAQSPGATVQSADVRVVALLDEADRATLALKLDLAHARVDEALALAEKLNDRVGVAMSHRMKGRALHFQGRARDGAAFYERALSEFEALGVKAGVAGALAGLAATSGELGERPKVLAFGERALGLYTELGDDRGRANVLVILVNSVALPAREATVQEILRIAERLQDDNLRGAGFKRQADWHFEAGEYSDAQTAYEAAIAAFEKSAAISSLAATYLSVGRVFRAHGDYEGALQRYRKAIELLEPTSERYTLVEATNASAIATGLLGRVDEALVLYERGLTLARESGNQRVIDFMEGNLAGGLMTAGQYARAIPALEAVIARKPDRSIAGYRYKQLAVALAHTGRVADAVAPADEAIRIARELKQTDELAGRLDTRAWILSLAGRLDDAVRDAREGIEILEQIRTKLVPSDFLKRGYGDATQRAYGRVIDLLSRAGRGADALERAEQGRARAFLDLLAARESATAELAVRGEAVPSVTPSRVNLGSEATGQTLDLAGVQALAERLRSTVVSYFVAEEATLVWVVRPGAAMFHTRLPVGRGQMASLVAGTTALLRPSAQALTTRGAEGADATTQATVEDLAALPMRGLGVLALSRDDRSAWRELYKMLIEPVRAELPARGGRLTIVPHGPLFHLSFAALQNAAGRYLLEDYELHYAPAVSALEFTGRRQQAIAANAAGPWAIVGNPAALPLVGKRALAPLPGAAREIASIAALAPRAGAVRLDRAGADEAALLRMLETSRPSLLHFATHGFVFDDPKTAPFLALNRRGTADAEDGRLTLDEVYALDLATDLVVLSACRTGSGSVSSDGIVGLTRGFFYAGSPSVMATFWDVTDEATAVLMSAFYRNYSKAQEKSRSLRTAQLALLADLRAGKVAVTASGRRIALPEHPLLWAGFFLSGEP